MVMAALEMPNLPVVTTGGCLVGEVWLGVPDQEAGNG